MKAPCKIRCCFNISMCQPCKVCIPSTRPKWALSGAKYIPRDRNLLSLREANFHLLFFLIARWNWTPVLLPLTGFNSIFCHHLEPSLSSYKMIPWKHFTRSLGLTFYSFSTSDLQFIQLFLMAEFSISVTAGHSSLNTFKYGLVYIQQKITLNLNTVFLLLPPRLSIVLLGASLHDLFSGQMYVVCKPPLSQLTHG